MIDPDGQRGIGSVHWVAYGIPANRRELKEGEGGTPSTADITNGKNSRGTMGYAGPCGPPIDAPHHYVIDVIALDVAPDAFQPGLDREQLLKLIAGHSLGHRADRYVIRPQVKRCSRFRDRSGRDASDKSRCRLRCYRARAGSPCADNDCRRRRRARGRTTTRIGRRPPWRTSRPFAFNSSRLPARVNSLFDASMSVSPAVASTLGVGIST
jgi:Raf kinase inhibitor-like YbhB/YbcL family protein